MARIGTGHGLLQLGGMTVRFGGLGAGQQTGTGSDGTFLLILIVSPTVSGNVTAVADVHARIHVQYGQLLRQ